MISTIEKQVVVSTEDLRHPDINIETVETHQQIDVILTLCQDQHIDEQENDARSI